MFWETANRFFWNPVLFLCRIWPDSYRNYWLRKAGYKARRPI